MDRTQYEHVTHRDTSSDLVLRLDAIETALLGADVLNLGADFHTALRALAEIRAGRWDFVESDPELDEGVPGARQRARMEETAHGLRDLLERLEALQAVTIRSWRARGASYGAIGQALKVSRSTAQDRVKALTATTPLPGEHWVRGAAPVPAVCDHVSVGVIVQEAGHDLLIRRAHYPYGWAPVAGHLDQHGDPEAAARQEMAEETGLTVRSLLHVNGGWRPNRCRRLIRGGRPAGHHWTIYSAEVDGELSPSAAETMGAGWFSPAELQALAERTIAYAKGEIPEIEWLMTPGLEPVWLHWLTRARHISVSGPDLQLVETIAARPPTSPV
ncbi:NUDIX hydrolase [Streptosporangium saharense]|uniref:ADP-ribose pyrophosphatase YjhB (NUDIX family) n=1 Tax=Streptosporangium saharense TaxID=1706840 RepID=A0A7W7VT10_9ACTN|nr:NUDIX domain-containing protein [Streptosporangium saharense]MBB4920955.1 ADP-ribose pyrophosphatase YjhB (NUDIX family) [Streptosporangium saharense]